MPCVSRLLRHHYYAPLQLGRYRFIVLFCIILHAVRSIELRRVTLVSPLLLFPLLTPRASSDLLSWSGLRRFLSSLWVLEISAFIVWTRDRPANFPFPEHYCESNRSFFCGVIKRDWTFTRDYGISHCGLTNRKILPIWDVLMWDVNSVCLCRLPLWSLKTEFIVGQVKRGRQVHQLNATALLCERGYRGRMYGLAMFCGAWQFYLNTMFSKQSRSYVYHRG